MSESVVENLQKIAEKMFENKDPRKHGGFLKLGVGAIIVSDDEKILLELRSDCGMWGLIGGKMELGESVLDTLHREVFEETGLKVDVVSFLGIYSEPTRVVTYPDNGDVAQLVDFCFVARPLSGILKVSDESLDLRFFKLSELPQSLVPPSVQPLRDYREGRRCVVR